MPHKIRFTSAAARDLERLSRPMQQRVASAVEKLAKTPRPRGCKKLSGEDNQYRFRIGNYRLLYRVDDGELVVIVIRIRDRKDVYRRPAA